MTHLGIRVLALVAAFFLATATMLNRLLYSFTKDNYWRYQLLFYLFLFALSFIAFPPRAGTISVARALLWGALSGYVAALLAFFWLPLLQDRSLHRVLTFKDLSDMFFLSPLIVMSWMVGVYFGLIMIVGHRTLIKYFSSAIASLGT